MAWNNRNLLSHSSGGQRSEINNPGLKWRCQQGHTPSGGCRIEFIPCLRLLTAAALALACGCITPISASVVRLLSLLFIISLSLFISPSLSRSPYPLSLSLSHEHLWLNFGPTWIVKDSWQSLHLEILNLITLAKCLPYRSTACQGLLQSWRSSFQTQTFLLMNFVSRILILFVSRLFPGPLISPGTCTQLNPHHRH